MSIRRYDLDFEDEFSEKLAMREAEGGDYVLATDYAALHAAAKLAHAALAEADSEMRDLFFDHPVRERNREAIAALEAAGVKP